MKKIYFTIACALLCSATYAQSNPIAELSEADVPGLTANDGYTFHFYAADGKLYKGFTEVFIALKDRDGHFVEDFSVSNFHPLMDMGMSKHSTPVGKVEKADGKPLYKTWIAFLMYSGQMGGTWSLDFDYTIGVTSGKIIGAVPNVTDVPAGQKWIQAFNSVYYASLAYPQSYVDDDQTLQVYINLRSDVLQPYQIVEGGYKFVVTPWMVDMGHGSETKPTVTLLWNAEKGVYEGESNFGMEGDWRLYFKVLDAETDALVAGADGAESTLYWDIVVKHNDGFSGIQPIDNGSEVKVYPTLTQGDVTVVVSVDATVNVFNSGGQHLQSHVAAAHTPLRLNIGGKGLYLISIQAANGDAVTRKVIVR